MPTKLAAKAQKKATMSKKPTKPAEVKAKAKTAAKPVARPAAKAAVRAAAKPTAKTAAKAVKPAAKGAEKMKPIPVKRASRAEQAAERKEMQKFRQLLLTEKARLEAELEEIESRTSRTSDAERATELSSYDDHPADLASETFEREKDLAIGESLESLLDQVQTALEKVERGTYGVCDACGRPIKRARLQALPFATLCLECQDRLEG